MSNTLVIHPSDPTTDCLEYIYRGRGWDVINDVNTSDEEVRKAIQEHDTVLMLGHGTPFGLLCGDGKGHRFSRYIINDTHAELLKEKKTFSIWCHSDVYFRRHNIPGFHSGMVISEVGEEIYELGEEVLTESEMKDNMTLYCALFREYLDLDDPKKMVGKILSVYNRKDRVTKFNRKSFIVL